MLDQVAVFNILLKISEAANRGDARSKARDIGDSANDCMDNFVDVVAHHRRSLRSFAFHQHGITIRRVLVKISRAKRFPASLSFCFFFTCTTDGAGADEWVLLKRMKK